MKSMTCKQLGGACNMVFTATTFEGIAEQSKQHGMEMFRKGDMAHKEAMGKMQALMQTPEAMEKWFQDRRAEFQALPHDDE